MTIDDIRAICAALPHVTEDVKWEHDLVFSIGKKMFAVVNLEPGETWLSFKCTPEEFAELIKLPGCSPALNRLALTGYRSNRRRPCPPARSSGGCEKLTIWRWPSCPRSCSGNWRARLPLRRTGMSGPTEFFTPESRAA